MTGREKGPVGNYIICVVTGDGKHCFFTTDTLEKFSLKHNDDDNNLKVSTTKEDTK